MLLDRARSQLVVVDVQERLMPAIVDAERVIRHAGILIAAAGRLGIPITVTEQYPKGLGSTISSLAQILPSMAFTLPKMTFSASADPDLAARIDDMRGEGRDQIVLCGAEAHVCVLQSALGFKAKGAEVFVVADAVSSRSPHSIEAARDRMLQAGVRLPTTEMAVFEWLERAGTDEFKALSALIK